MATKKPSSMKRTGKARPKPKSNQERMKLLGTGGAAKAAAAILRKKAALKKAAKGY
jgi:shikimate 5-dehydrogenase